MVQRSDSLMPDALHNYESVLHDSHIEKKKAARLPDSLCFSCFGIKPSGYLAGRISMITVRL